MSLHLTQHAAERLAQRAMNLSDVDLIMEIGSEVHDGYLVCEKDYQEVERAMKQFLRRARRLKGKRLVVANGRLVTAFHAKPKQERRILRASPDRS